MAYTGTPAVGRGEAQVFNLAPFYNEVVRERQQKQLEKQMIDKQIADDLSKYSADGLRQQDVSQFLNQYQNLKNLSIQYRDAIRNPAKNPAAWNEYQNAKSKLVGLIAESKAAKDNTKSLYDFRAKNLEKLDDDAFRQAMLLYNAPIGTPEHDQVKTFDQAQLVFKPEKFDTQKWGTHLANIVKPIVRSASTDLPSGRYRTEKFQYRDPLALSSAVAEAFDADFAHSKKFYTTQFENASEEDIKALQDYASQYLPQFSIEGPRDFAIAANLYGQVQKDMGASVGGSPYLENQAFQERMQNRRFAHAEKMAKESAAKKEKDTYLWENDIANYMRRGDTENVRRLATELESSTPGVERVFLKEGETKQAAMNLFKRELKKSGLDGKTKYLTDADFKTGVLVVAVPKTDKNGNRLPNQYEYLAVSAREPNIQNRLNKLKNYAIGGSIKPLSDEVYNQPAVTGAPVYNLDELSPLNEDQ